jgi:hypothetical protein
MIPTLYPPRFRGTAGTGVATVESLHAGLRNDRRRRNHA